MILNRKNINLTDEDIIRGGNYKSKYLKYKNKYLQLKNQIGGFIPTLTIDTQTTTDTKYKNICRKQVPFLCGEKTNQAGFCRRNERDCINNEFGKSYDTSFIYQDKDSVDNGLYLYRPNKEHTKNLPIFSRELSKIKSIKDEYLNKLTKIYDTIANLDKTRLTYNNVFIFENEELSKYLIDIIPIKMNRYLMEPMKSEMAKLNIDLDNFTYMRPDVLNVILHYYNNQYKTEKPNLTYEQIRNLEIIIQDNEYNNLNKTQTELMLDYNTKINNNMTAWDDNIVNSIKSKYIEYIEEQLSGLEKYIEEWKNDENIYNKITKKFKIHPNNINMEKIMKNCTNRETRKTYESLQRSRCMENLPILLETIHLRQKKAQLLGYESNLEFKIKKNMPKEKKNLDNFINNLRIGLEPLLNTDTMLFTKYKLMENKNNQKFINDIIDRILNKINNINIKKNLEIIKQKYNTIIEKNNIINELLIEINNMLNLNIILFNELIHIIDIKSYDEPYYKKIIRDTEANFNFDDIRHYFTIESVTNGIFEIYQNLLGFKFIDITSDYKESIYHEDVKLFAVYDKNNLKQVIGYFYLDLFFRDGKQTTAWTQPYNLKSIYSLPIVSLICSFGKKTKSKHIMPSFNNVVTYFHEFGHLMHAISSTTTIGELSGIGWGNGSAFVEIPSQLFEQWCYYLEPLKLLAEPEYQDMINDDLITKINKQRKILISYDLQPQVRKIILDIYLNDINIPKTEEELLEFDNSLGLTMHGWEITKDINSYITFKHIVSNYSSEYYGYEWSFAYSIDLFSFFSNGNLFNKTLGLKLRDTILSKGSSKDGLTLLRDFMGREPNLNAYIEWLKS